MSGSAALVLHSVGGPDAGWSCSLGVGGHWIGRAGDVRVADPALEAHHALLEVDRDGCARLLHVAGRTGSRVDGTPADSWCAVSSGSVIELGHTRLVAGASKRPVASPVSHVYVPLDSSERELQRFARDVRRAADSAGAGSAAAGSTRRVIHVVLGEGVRRLPVRLRDRDDRPVEPSCLDHAAQAVLDREVTRVLPVTTSLDASTRLAVVAGDPQAVVRSVLDQVGPRQRTSVLVAGTTDVGRHAGGCRPVLVVGGDADEVPAWCTSLLVVGATWWGTWQHDLRAPDVPTVRLHVRGRRGQPGPAPGGRSSLSR